MTVISTTNNLRLGTFSSLASDYQHIYLTIYSSIPSLLLLATQRPSCSIRPIWNELVAIYT